MTYTRRLICIALFVFSSVAVCAAEAQNDSTLRSDYKYAWPRERQIVLDGPWELAWTEPPEKVALPENLDKLDWLKINEPAEVHWALHRAGKTPHPYVGLNIKKMRWVEDKSWWYRKKFVVPEDFKGQLARLVVEGVDYYGHYWLNGEYLGRSEGALGATIMLVTSAHYNKHSLRYGSENELVVRVDCGGYKLGKEGGAPRESLVKSELWSGWRVGAYDYNTVGIWQPIRLVSNDWPCLERPFVRTIELEENRAKVRVTVDVSTLLEKEKPCEVTVTIRGKGFESEPVTGTTQVRPIPHAVLANVDLTVSRPRLWWPNGLGEQPMYEAEIFLSRDGKPLDRLTVPFGIRTIERKPGDPNRAVVWGQVWKNKLKSCHPCEWIFHVNGKPIFVKGTNWMPIDALADVRAERYEWHLSMARDAGIQMIRVWGGGIIEPDVFYELCDRYGIMVWQDFPLTCGWKAEKIDRRIWNNTVRWAIYRLRNHPSLAFWCGGNEFPPDDPANVDLVGIMAHNTRILDGTRPFMAASPYEGDIHAYRQWDASWAWQSELVRGPFISEWGSHGMPSFQTYKEIVNEKEAGSRIGPTVLKMDKKLMEREFPEIIHHWVQFTPGYLSQMLSRGSAFDNLAEASLERFTEAIAAGAAEFYKYSAEAARFGYPRNGGLLFWVWKRPWPIVGIQICDGLGQPPMNYYDVKRAYSSPWPCIIPPHLNYVPGEQVELKTIVLSEENRSDVKNARLVLRLIGPDLKERQSWKDLPPLDVPSGSEAVEGPAVKFTVPEDFGRSFFFAIAELHDADGKRLARNVYTFRCPPQLEDEAFRKQYRSKPNRALLLDEGPWLRPQLEKHATELAAKIVSAVKESDTRARLTVEVRNVGRRPAVMTNVHVEGRLRYVADDAYFWLEPGEKRTVRLRLRLADGRVPSELVVAARAWNVLAPTLKVPLK